MAIPIAIVDDRPINRQTMRDKIAAYPEMQLVFEARNGQDFLEQMKHQKPEPTVVLMDLDMPVMDGIEAIRIGAAAYPDCRFIVITVFEDNEKIFEAIRAGASGYLLKEDTAVNIIDAITNVVEYNGIPMSPVIAQKAMELLRNAERPVPEKQVDTAVQLSDRELSILKELVKGRNYKAIGETLFISPLTVRKHVSNIYTKLHVGSRTQAISIAQKNRWI